jgi:hypothetical protein
MNIKTFLFVIVNFTFACTYAQDSNQELSNLLYSGQVAESIKYYAQHKTQVTHPFVLDSYKIMKNIFEDKTDSVLVELPIFINRYYEEIFSNDAWFTLLQSQYFSHLSDNDKNRVVEQSLNLLQNNIAFLNNKENNILKFRKITEKAGKAINYEQELTNLVSAYDMSGAIAFYEQYGDAISHPFVVDFYEVMKNIYQNNDSVAQRQMPEFLNNFYGGVIDNNFLLHLLNFSFQIGKRELGNTVIDNVLLLLIFKYDS